MNIKVLFIMGYVRSGSTLPDTVLSDPPGVFGAGELVNLIHAMDVSHNYCACGELSQRCPLWREVRQEWSRNEGDDVAAEYQILQSHFEHLGDYPKHRRQHHPDDGLLNKYLWQSRALFKAIANTSGAATIVDSSKRTIRALALSRMENVDFPVIHLVRDVRGVACSNLKRYEKDPVRGIMTPLSGINPAVTARRWTLVNAVANRVRMRLADRAILVRHEDFVTQPLMTLKRLSEFAEMDWTSTTLKLQESGEFHAGHMIEGNRLRMRKQIRLKPDNRWKKELSTLQKTLLPLLTAPVSWLVRIPKVSGLVQARVGACITSLPVTNSIIGRP